MAQARTTLQESIHSRSRVVLTYSPSGLPIITVLRTELILLQRAQCQRMRRITTLVTRFYFEVILVL